MNKDAIILDVVKERIRRRIDLLGLRLANFDVVTHIDREVDSLVVDLVRRRPHKLLDSITIEKPSSWWEHFKETFFPTVLLKYFPVKYEKIVINAEAFYDRVPLPEQATEVRLYGVESGVK